MGWGSGGRDDGEPTLAEAWNLLAARTGLDIEEAGDDRVRARGHVRGRAVSVEISSARRGSELLASFARTPRRGRAHRIWTTELSVGCENPRGLTGVVATRIDIEDPRWDPRNFDPSHCRVVSADPPELEGAVVSDAVRERLMGLIGDHEIAVEPGAVRLSAQRKSGDGYFVGSPIHVEYPNAPQPWPERALAGPPWWIDLLCDIADGLDGAEAR